MAKVALIGPKEAPLMPMTFRPKDEPSKSFNFDATPDTGASISIIAEDVAKIHNLSIDKKKKM